ncbi:hypothetical protein KIK06_25415 [Nocardiopsis sp. EMB25]|uniref:hypothetical protein n=1 Tax=Nocardiopsis sp. EMB25 TaxID=2835867 RepID=UPI00228380BA|nr:hypothetical protein [Nocardiopsis sp. EMB25]MCY9787225.1 hypothetical protein [Nocardiopsis sp. EMB25]
MANLPIDIAEELPREFKPLAQGDFSELRRVVALLLKVINTRAPAEDPAGFARAVRNGAQ